MSDGAEVTVTEHVLPHSLWERTQGLMEHMGWPFNDEGKTWGMLDGGVGVPITENVGHGTQAFLHIAFVAVILVALAGYVYSQVKDNTAALVPEGKLTARTFVEVLVGASYGLMKDIMGAKAARYFLPLIGTCAFIILFSNALGLIPGFFPPSSSLSLTLALGVIIFFATHIYGVREHGLAYFKHFFGPIIAWYALPLMLLMLVVEIISHLVRPMSLGIRLMANMFADHLVLAKFGMLGAMLWGLIFGASAELPLLIPVPALLLGSLVVVVQTMVFCLLSTVYIAMAIEHGEDH